MNTNPSAIMQQRRVRSHAGASDAYAFFNLLTSPELFNQLEAFMHLRHGAGEAVACGWWMVPP